MKTLSKNLIEWVAHDLISQDQAEKILEYSKGKKTINYYTYMFFLLGAFVIGVGVISLIAVNWFLIPDWLKLVLDFSILGSLAFFIAKMDLEKHPYRFETLLAIFMMLSLASIGLISQVYHTGGKLEHALLFWCIITLFCSVLSKKIVIPFVWTTTLLSTIIYMLFETNAMRILFGSRDAYVLIPMTLPILLTWVCSILGFFQRGKLFLDSLRTWIFITGMASIGYFEIGMNFLRLDSFTSNMYIYIIVISILAILTLFLRKDFTIKRKILISFLIFFYTLMYIPVTHYFLGRSIAAPFLTIMILFLASVHFATLGNRRLFSFLSFLIAVRFLAIYIQAFWGLALTGLGLIISGILIIAVVAIWQKKRDLLENFAQRIMR